MPLVAMTLEFVLDAVLDARSGAQQQDEHENPPGHAETGEKGPQPVGAYGGEYFLETGSKYLNAHNVNFALYTAFASE